MLNITLANRFESLLDSLLDSIAEGPASPLVPLPIIVPSAAIRRKLSLSIADRYGICSNVQFSFLAQWLWRQIGQVIPSVAAESPFAPPVLAWRVFQIFDDASFLSRHSRLGDYLREADAVMRYDLAARAASLIEQYMTYRPDWLAAWADGKSAQAGNADTARHADEQWQAALWRRITEELGTDRQHPATTFLRAVESMGREAPRRTGLPETAYVFCLPTMSPLYIDTLRQLGRWIELRLYVLNPCREYWFEVVDRRRLGYLTLKGKADYHEEGNRLLAAWANQTQAYVDLLLEDAAEAIVEDGQFEADDSGTLLAQVQNAILDLVDIAPKSITLEENDRSIEVHVCHSLTRELEVLQDQLLALFAGPDPLQPSDILVVTPDLETAAPLIEAVFGNVPKDRFIAYTVTGRPRSTLNAAARALLALLSLVTSRFQASAVFDLLQQPIVGRRFGIVGDELTSVRGWIREAAIRWGIDATHRSRFALPALERHSFLDGLDRLYLGYALPAGSGSPFNERLPAGDPEGSACVALGSFWYFVDRLVRLQRELSVPTTSGDWMNRLFDTLDAFLSPSDEEIDDFREVQETLRELHASMSRGGILAPVPLEVVRTVLEGLLDDPTRGGMPTGTVTFSSMSSLRNLPFRIICAIGLNDGLFPTASRPPEFDLMAAEPRRGDRQRRVDERNLFFDLLLAARDRFYLSYTGRSIRDNVILPASVLVSDLVEYLVPAIATDPASPVALAAARRRLVIEHPLQPFSPACFSDSGDVRRKSFNSEYCDALKKRARATAFQDNGERMIEERDDAHDTLQAFFHRPLAEPGEEWRAVSMERLIQFFKNPCRYLLTCRLGIDLAAADADLQDDEPFLPDLPGRTALAERLLSCVLEGSDPSDIRTLGLAGTEYPAGRLGERLLERELQTLVEFAEEVKRATVPACRPPHHASLAFDLHGESWRLSGAFSDLRPTGLVRYRYDDVRAVDYLAGWLSHLFLCATEPKGVALETAWHSRDGRYRLRSCEAPHETLRELVRLYRRGLREPIHFFPRSAWKFIANGESFSMATSAWRCTRQRPFGEEAHPAYRLALRGRPNPLDAEFEACAKAVFGTMMTCLEDARL